MLLDRLTTEKLCNLDIQPAVGQAIFRKGNIVYVNEALSDILEFTAEEIRSWGKFKFLKLIHKADRNDFLNLVRNEKFGIHMGVSHSTIRVCNGGGKLRWLKQQTKWVTFAGESSLLVTGIDVTDFHMIYKARQLQVELLSVMAEKTEWKKKSCLVAEKIRDFSELEAGQILLKGEQTQIPLFSCSCPLLLNKYSNRQNIFYTDSGSVYLPSTTRYLHDGNSKTQPKCHSCIHLAAESLLLIPLKVKEEMLGIVVLSDSRPDALKLECLNLLETIAQPLAYCLGNLRYQSHLEKSESLFRVFAENARDMIFRIRFRPEVCLDYISPSVEDVFGYPPEVFYRDPYFYFRVIHHEDVEKLENHIYNNKTTTIAFRCRHKSGNYMWVEQTHVLVYSKHGELTAIQGIAKDISERKQLEEELRCKNRELKKLSSSIMNVQEAERVRLARELHDEVGQILTSVKLSLQLLRENLADLSEMAEIEYSISLVETALQQVREKASFLRPPLLEQFDLMGAVRKMAQGIARISGLEKKFVFTGRPVRLAMEVETTIYRCIQEALTNVARHAGAQYVNILFTWMPGGMSFRVEDNGVGFDVEEVVGSATVGLTGMKERMALINGSLAILSVENKGTTIEGFVPVNEPEVTCCANRNRR